MHLQAHLIVAATTLLLLAAGIVAITIGARLAQEEWKDRQRQHHERQQRIRRFQGNLDIQRACQARRKQPALGLRKRVNPASFDGARGLF